MQVMDYLLQKIDQIGPCMMAKGYVEYLDEWLEDEEIELNYNHSLVEYYLDKILDNDPKFHTVYTLSVSKTDDPSDFPELLNYYFPMDKNDPKILIWLIAIQNELCPNIHHETVMSCTKDGKYEEQLDNFRLSAPFDRDLNYAEAMNEVSCFIGDFETVEVSESNGLTYRAGTRRVLIF